MHTDCTIEIKKNRQGVYVGNSSHSKSDAQLAIGPDTELRVKGQTYTLHQLIKGMLHNDNDILSSAFDERGQLDLGQYLFSQISALCPKGRHHSDDDTHYDLHIITDDEHISRLPWVLLAKDEMFLATTGWSVSLASQLPADDCELPPSPELLLIAPQPKDQQETHASLHLEALEQILKSRDPRLCRGKNLRVVESWDELRAEVSKSECKPDIVYYYGHGQGSEDKSSLVFSSASSQKSKIVPMADFANLLRSLKKRPRVAYINCCHGDTGGMLGAGRQLGSFVSAVITNRTVATVRAAQDQAIALWSRMILDGASPHRALSDLCSHMSHSDLSVHDIRWMTPVLHRHYKTWKAHPPRDPAQQMKDPNWTVKLDRVKQYGIVSTMIRQAIKANRTRVLAFVWYGLEGEGMEVFHERLRVDLREDLASCHVHEVRPHWPMEYSDSFRSFSDMLIEAFEVQRLEHIPPKIRGLTRGQKGGQTVVYIRHEPVFTKQRLSPERLRDYLEWWEKVFSPHIEPHQFMVVGISFIVKNPSQFHSIIINQLKLEEIEFKRTEFHLLDEMERVARRDLINFLRAHELYYAETEKNLILEHILKSTEGHYDKTVAELKVLVEKGSHLLSRNLEVANPEHIPEDDY